MNIVFQGKYQREKQFKRKRLPEDATRFSKPISVSKTIVAGGWVSFPLLMLSTAILAFKIVTFPQLNLLMLLVASLLGVTVSYFREIVRALSFPWSMKVELWSNKKDGALFIYFDQPISRGRFMWVSFVPNLFLGVIPFILFAFGLLNFNLNFAMLIGLVSWLMILAGVGDYLNVYNTLKYIPKEAKILRYGYHFYWSDSL